MSMFSVLVLGAVMATRTLVTCCPRPEELAPHCFCMQFAGESVMSCSGVLSPEDLVAPLRSVAIRGTKIFSFELRDSSLQYIPHGVFEGTSIEKVRFVNSEIMSLSDTDVAFAGLEDTLTEIRATEAEYIASWDWQQLRNLGHLDLIDVNQIVMGALDEPFPKLPSLRTLGITSAGITQLVDGAFAGLSGLRTLALGRNELVELRRNMLPEPAEHLLTLDLSDNRLSSLPEDFFSGMPSLESVHLDNNQFVTLAETPFAPALQQLNEFTMTGNPIRCDCRLRWISSEVVSSNFLVTCSIPESLKGRRLIFNLDVNHLWC